MTKRNKAEFDDGEQVRIGSQEDKRQNGQCRDTKRRTDGPKELLKQPGNEGRILDGERKMKEHVRS